ncbi:hypothetical protein IEQ34_019916 [Dendrobium chrysotoxum]|uniref:Uncharacterized protein n=1 Tax=Dendrobium chrysotoxum TaxID=161865 RepID=A0AAV7GA26_DENCH|nr:hypothetical protein IEQ34_019916 [Dendrobium chrysotoxum]
MKLNCNAWPFPVAIDAIPIARAVRKRDFFFALEKNVISPDYLANIVVRVIDFSLNDLLERGVDREETHQNETHGTSDDIDENTPIDKVKGPGVFERVKEEIEALVEAIHPKKEKGDEDGK